MKTLNSVGILKENFKITKEQRKLFYSLKKGDVISAKIQLGDIDFRNSEIAQRYEDYLVIGKGFNCIYAYKISKYDLPINFRFMNYNINLKKYNQKGDSHLSLRYVYKIPISDISRKKYSLDFEDKKNIQRRITICTNKTYLNEKYKISLDVPINITVGDIIRVDKELYLIYSINEFYIECFKLFKLLTIIDVDASFDKVNETMRVVINNEEYFVNYNKPKHFVKKTRYDLLDYSTIEEMKIIFKDLEAQKSRFDRMNVENKYYIGKVFDVNGKKISYLFSVNGVDYGIDIDNYKNEPVLTSIDNIGKYKVINYQLKQDYIDVLYKNKATPFAPIEDLYEKTHSWYEY